MLLGHADVYAGAQGYPLFTMSRKPPPVAGSGRVALLHGYAVGGASRDRTDDLKLAKLALSQLSYGPSPISSATAPKVNSLPIRHEQVVGLGRFELPTSRLSSARSNQLSYRPKAQASMRRKRNVGGGVPLCISKRNGRASKLANPPHCPSESANVGVRSER